MYKHVHTHTKKTCTNACTIAWENTCTNTWTMECMHKHTWAHTHTQTGDYSPEEVQALMRESVKMKLFDHPNVMNLLGVCLDAGPAPYLVLPFMSGGDLLSHIKGCRGSLVVESDAEEGTVRSFHIIQHALNYRYLIYMYFMRICALRVAIALSFLTAPLRRTC